MTIEVREARPDEYARVGELTQAAYETLWPDGVGGYGDVIGAVAERARHDEVWVAAVDGAVIGSSTYVSDPASPSVQWDDPDAAGFRLLAVDVERRGLGAGRALFDAVLTRARADGHPRVRIHSHKLMHVAVAMYERAGFVRDPDTDFVDDDDEAVIAYVLHLSSTLRCSHGVRST